LFTFVGRDFFPAIDAGQIQLHVRAPPGTRIETTTQIFQAIENKIRQIVPESDRDIIVDNIGLPARTYNYAFMDGTAIGVNDGVILVALKEGHAPTADYVKKLRQALPEAFPEEIFYFQPADIATQILNFGIPTQIDVRTVGYDRTKNLAVAKDLRRRLAAIPGLVDVHLQQELDGPDFLANIDRARATQFGLTASGIANDINISLSSSEQVTPNFWTDPTSGIPYYLAVQTPQYLADSLNEIKNTPIGAIAAPITGAVPGLLSNVATFTRDTTPTNLNQANIQPVYEVFANTQGRDLGSVSSDIGRIIADEQKQLRPGNTIQVVGQIDSMNTAFQNMSLGLVFAAIFVYLLMVVNYQTWADPFVVILALPATLCGALTMLFITGTTLSVPSLMGMIMAVGVASANSILLVTYARDEQLAGKPARQAAVEAGVTRIRPVLMTATAMIVGMLPMAIGEPGGEQNAALARAVVGGLLFATPTTLLLVPYLFATLRKGADGKAAHGVFAEGLE
jgi:multidrug efflux pump subunit AcrB